MNTPIEQDSGPERRTDRAHLWIAVSLFGFLLIATGLAVDFVLHANDSALAADEGLFTLRNPGHLLLAIGVVATAVGLGRTASTMIGTTAGEFGMLRLGRLSLRVGLVVLITAMVYIATGPGFDSSHGDDINELLVLSDGVDRSRLPHDEAVALATLAWSRSGSLSQNVHDHHDHSESAPSALEPDQVEALAVQVAAAASIVPLYKTVADAEAAGYVQGSGENDGTGAHWIKWSLVDRPFDPETPSMLLFDELKSGEGLELIAFSYWVASEEEPEGFAGDTDKWHTHVGMCFENGWLRNDNIPDRRSCDGDWVNGSDLWMLHAWVVPGLENEFGMFAVVNPLLCERACGLEN